MFGEYRKWTREQRDIMLETLPVTAPKVMGEFPPGAFDTEEGTQRIVANWGLMVRALFEQDKFLNQAGFVFCTRDHTGAPSHVVIHTEIKTVVNDRSKDCLADAMKLVASMCQGVATIMVSEAWMCVAKPEDYSTVEAWRKQHGTLRGHPDTVEVAMMLVETHRGCRLHKAKIVRHADGSRTLGEWECSDEQGVSEGRFTGLLRSENLSDA